MAKIDLTQLIAEMKPEQKIFFNDFYTRFDNGGAANRRIINVVPLCFYGAIATSEFITYATNKLYICLNVIFSANANNQGGTNGVLFYDEANTLQFNLANALPYYDTSVPAARYFLTGYSLENIYFSRIDISASVYSRMRFIGYKFTLQ